jgi:hypothetical protein
MRSEFTTPVPFDPPRGNVFGQNLTIWLPTQLDKSVTAIYVGVNGQVVRSSDVSARVPGFNARCHWPFTHSLGQADPTLPLSTQQ